MLLSNIVLVELQFSNKKIKVIYNTCFWNSKHHKNCLGTRESCCPGFSSHFNINQFVLPHPKIISQAGTKEMRKQRKWKERKKWKRKQKKPRKVGRLKNTKALPLLVWCKDVGSNFNNLWTIAAYSVLTMVGLRSKNCLNTIPNPYHSRKGTLHLPVWQNVTLI